MQSVLLNQKSKSGQALVEYALLLSMAAVLALGFFSVFSNLTQNGIVRFNAVLESELRTSKFQNPSVKDIWEN